MKRFLLISIVFIFILFSCENENTNQPIPPNNELTEKALLEEINFARTNPKQYANILKNMLQYFDGKLYKEPGEITLITNEGAAAVNEAINFLMNTQPIQALELSEGLSKACRDHVLDQGPKGAFGHDGSDGSTPWDRIAKYGKANGYMAENISYGAKTARKVIVQLIVDDGVASRGHRTNIFNKNLNFVGFAYGFHSKYQIMTVMDFAQNFTEK